MEFPVPKPSWTFPSPFIPYAVATESREEICWGPQPRTLAEFAHVRIVVGYRSKSEWQRKIIDPSIMEKWRKEALLTVNMVNYVLTELAGYARLSDPVSGIECGPFDAIWYSDRLVSDDVSDRLRAAVADLENVPEDSKDWHPGSNGQVLDLVHPSLYCVVYDRTRFADSTLPKPPAYEPPKFHQWAWGHVPRPVPVSNSFCWLPSDFFVDATDGSVKLVSPYINNLHPGKHKSLYPLIESVLSSFVPLFERVLSQINGQDKDIFRDISPGFGRIKTDFTYGEWSGFNQKFAGVSVPCIWSKGNIEITDAVSEMNEAEFQKVQEEAPMVLPESFEEYTGELEKTIEPYSLRGKTIQCIIKLANIHLTAENPEYKGGSWHVEAMLNERIVASGIYYYKEENISESRLAFRVTTGAPVYHEQDDEVCMRVLYGLARDTHLRSRPRAQLLRARVALLRGPNVYQHRVAPFHLVDATKPGHRKILAIFLVDPSIEPIPSATNVPPQQADWTFDALEEARNDPNSNFSRLPPELSNLIQEQLPNTFMTRKEAEEYRLKLMEERTNFVQARDEEL
ncbi:hypothetical protein DFH06DRAFT_1466913, partial [Mycena polygramma]